MSRWLVIGSSPSVLETLPRVDAALPSKVVITCNSGIKLWPTPSVYFLVDQLATLKFEQEARIAQQHGTILATLLRGQKAQQERHIEHFDEHLILSNDKPTRTQFGAYRYTGPLCIEYACHREATEVHLVGMDGYRFTGDYFDPDSDRKHTGKCQYEKGTVEVLEPRIRELVQVWHDVEFHLYGDPCYSVSAPNWHVHSEVAA